MEPDRNDMNIDELLEDLRGMLEPETPPEEAAQPELSAEPTEAAPEPEAPVKPQPLGWAETQKLPRHVAKLQQNQGAAYEKWLQEQTGQEQAASTNRSWTETQKLPRHVAKLQQNQGAAYDEWLREAGQIPPADPEQDLLPTQAKKGKGLGILIISLLAFIVALSAVIVFLLPTQPKADAAGARAEGVSTLLLAGLDASGTRTDTLMLLTLDANRHSVRLVSIPRDTLVPGDYNAPRLSGVYGLTGGGKTGTDALMAQVAQLVGFRPDGYVIMTMQALEAAVDALGGVDFDVPMDMSYRDPAQNLVIDLKKGPQHLDGSGALALVLFRDGYSDADLGRIQTQRQLMAALMSAAASGKGLGKAPTLYRIFRQQVQTDLTAANWLWLTKAALGVNMDKISSATLPGSITYISGTQCYTLDPELTAAMVTAYSSPYAWEITPQDLEIPTK